MSHKHTKRTTNLIAATAILAGLPAMAYADSHVPELTHTEVISGLENPWDIALFDDGTMLYTEKCRGLSVREPNGDVNHLLGLKDTKDYSTTEKDLFCQGQAGMNGVAIAPNFEDNR
ncbi:PQQ-dependent sugar dehydrogenase, partial [Methylophaga sp.]|uniref:PQQ-dependent sugar dehydrogenase n=1 Tax=Methylophaga sp. TaxID=2024840 RepID=UPI0013FF197F